MIIGSTKWFEEKSTKSEKIAFRENVEHLRKRFLDNFSPDKLKRMNGAELLNKVFDNTHDTMMHLLMYDQEYRMGFGASSEYAYMSIIYKGSDGLWTLFEKNKHIKLSKYDAENKAKEIRDVIISLISVISNSTLHTIEDYKILEKRLRAISDYYNYVTVLKYYQMLFPYYFPAMYSDFTLNRCIQILGLKQIAKSSNRRITNMGIISIFIRNCSVHTSVFGSIYADEWGWEGTRETCPAASENEHIISDNGKINKSFYLLENDELRTEEIAKKIDNEIGNLNLDGKERDVIVKLRVNQGEFRERLTKIQKKCRLCGVSDSELLVASHIKPWSASDSKEKLNPFNGLLLCPNHDKLFDRGFISFDDSGDIIISNRLSSNDRVFMNVNPDMHIEINEESRKFLEYHRNVIFKND